MTAPPPPLPGALAGLAPLLDHYGYLAVALLVLLDNCGIPVPGQTILVLASVYAGTGHLDFTAVLLIAAAAATLGNSIGYLIGRTGGRAFVHRWGRYVLLTPARMDRADGFFARHGGKVVLVARFVDGLRQYNGIIAGTTGMPWRRFAPFNLLGAVLWTAVWGHLRVRRRRQHRDGVPDGDPLPAVVRGRARAAGRRVAAAAGAALPAEAPAPRGH
ncbi:VTT domain-containing protein [Kitasatospora aureofaciens]|uniref:VTT domain-containing protein n=1 Tax=Kitasatospora aureofaciens TaxID=1894 RepID=UPI0007C46A4E